MTDNNVPVSEMAKDFLTTYKYGWKTSYYQNTYDMTVDADSEKNDGTQCRWFALRNRGRRG